MEGTFVLDLRGHLPTPRKLPSFGPPFPQIFCCPPRGGGGGLGGGGGRGGGGWGGPPRGGGGGVGMWGVEDMRIFLNDTVYLWKI